MADTFDTIRERLREFIARSDSADGSDPEGDCESWFNELAVRLFRLQYRSIAAYRRLCEARGVGPEEVAHWTQVPAAPAVAFKELELTSLTPTERTRVFHSSRTTTRTPSRHFHNEVSLGIYRESLLPWFRAHLLADLRESAALISLIPPALQAPNSSLACMVSEIQAACAWRFADSVGEIDPAGAWGVNVSAAINVLEKAIRADLPVVLLGTAFSFVPLLDQLHAFGRAFRLPRDSRIMETGGYKGRSRSMPKGELHSLISDRLGVPSSHIVCEYGMSELSSQAYDTIAGRPVPLPERSFRFPPWARAVVVSPENGRLVELEETGMLRVFDLANVHSVMSVQTEDLAVRTAGGFRLLGRASGAESRGCSLMAATV